MRPYGRRPGHAATPSSPRSRIDSPGSPTCARGSIWRTARCATSSDALVEERSRLVEKNETARSKVEQMIVRLKSLEAGQ